MELVTPGIGILFWMIVSFSIVMYILAKFAWKPILNALKEREEMISDALNSAKIAKDEMALIKSENEKILAAAISERDKMLKEAKDLKEQIVREAKDSANHEAAKILENAKAEIENQKNAALSEIKNVVATLAVDIAEKVLMNELVDKPKQMAFIEETLKNVELN